MGDPTGGPGAPDPSRPLWAGGFAGPPDPGMWAYTSSLAVDRRLWRQDVAGSRAHVRGLVAAGVLEEGEGKLLLDGLAQVARELDAGRFEFTDGDEDVHSAVERRLTELVGPAGGKLHTGRSRNDQVATALRLFSKRELARIARKVTVLQRVLLGRAD
ncbi:MAG TPA: lyase family protein, partial [Actinomycetes bacterium]